MKKNLIWKVAMITATMFVSCEKEDKTGERTEWENPTIVNKWTGDDKTKWEVVNAYVENVVLPTYVDLAKSAEQLYDASVLLQQKLSANMLTDADVEAVCEAFSLSRAYWERSEAFLYGAASDYSIDPHIDSWPMDQSQMAGFLTNASMVAGLNGADPIGFIRKHNNEFDTALGFHGIEFILWREGKARKADAFTYDEDYEGFVGKGVNGQTEAAFLVAVSGDLRDHCYELEYAWCGEQTNEAHKNRVNEIGLGVRAMNGHGYFYGADMLLAGYYMKDKSYLETTLSNMTAVMCNILLGGCSNICAEVADQKMGQGYRVATGEGGEEDASDYIESPYSKHSFVDYQGNIFSIKHSLYGNREDSSTQPTKNSILAYLKGKGYPKVETLDQTLLAAIVALQTCIDSGMAFSDAPGNVQVKNAIEAILALDDELNYAAEWISKQ